ncbi:MAG: M61 family peptidase, partial [Acidobacteriaceae bacterium]
DSEVFAAPKLREAVLKAEKGTDLMVLLVKEGDQVKTVNLDYHGGLRIPHLERVEGTPDRLDDILKPVE